MNKKILSVILFVYAFSAGSLQASSEGESFSQPYEVRKLDKDNLKKNNAKVLYFYNSNCPSCRSFSPKLNNWIANKDADFNYKEISVNPIKSWEWSSKAFYVANSINSNINRTTFEKLMLENNITSITNILSAADAVTIATGHSRGKIMTMLASKSLAEQTSKYDTVAIAYGVKGVPNIVVIGDEYSYRISPEFRLSHQGLINVTEALIKYEKLYKK